MSALSKVDKKMNITSQIDIEFNEDNVDCLLMPRRISSSEYEHHLAKNDDDDDDEISSVISFDNDRAAEASMITDWLCNSKKIDLGVYEDPYVLQSVMKKVQHKGVDYLHEFYTLY